jgi:predicted GNAT superfamily acetyltransferase
MTKEKSIMIRSLQQIEELEDVRKLESRIWGEADTIPAHQTITAVKNGGLVLGAYDGEKLIGFQYSFPGFNGTSVYLCSHILATDVEYRNKGIGKILKLAQREEALKLGYTLITWTYDPLESINGYLNIAKLGGVCSTYIANCYGEMDDLLNSGIPSDRFLVEWNIEHENNDDTNRRDLNLDSALPNSLIQWVVNEEGLPTPSSSLPFPEQTCNITFVAVPKDFQKIRESNLETAAEWRLKTRDIFTRLFKHGWKVTGFQKSSQADIPVNVYVLTK